MLLLPGKLLLAGQRGLVFTVGFTETRARAAQQLFLLYLHPLDQQPQGAEAPLPSVEWPYMIIERVHWAYGFILL